MLAETDKIQQLLNLKDILKIAEPADIPNVCVMQHICRSDHEWQLVQRALRFEEIAWRNHFCYLAECEYCGRIFLSSDKTQGHLRDIAYFDAAHEAVHRDWRARQLSAGQPLKRADFYFMSTFTRSLGTSFWA